VVLAKYDQRNTPMNMPAYSRIVTITLAILAHVACDPSGEPAIDGAEAASTKAAAAARDVKVVGPPPTSSAVGAAESRPDNGDNRGGFVNCLLACDAAKMSHTDKAACRYNCEDVTGPPPGARAEPTAANDTDPVASVVGCMSRCSTAGEPADACMSGCKTAVAASPACPPAAVLDELGTCIGACHKGKHTRETNLATCELNCAETARVAGPAQGTASTAR
jgi:hypothetical protein